MSGTAPTPPPVKKARTRRLSCPGCGGSIEVRANGISISAICGSCGRTIDVAGDDLRVIAEAQQATRTLTLPIGTRGTLAGTEWEVVGYQARSNPAEGWTWDEYLLFNPYRGFRFLAHDDEGWTLYCMLRQDIADPSHVEGDRHHYTGPETGQARTDYVLGEFYWRVRVGDTADTEQYAAGSTLLVKEVTGDEIVWSRAIPVPTAEVRAAFKLDPVPATPKVSERERTVSVFWTGLAAFILLLFTNGILGIGAPVVFQREYEVPASSRGKAIASDPFTIPDRGGNLRLDLFTPVQNNWVAFNLSLVAQSGAPVFDATRTIEYYTGYDSDGLWEEGGQNDRVMFRSVPGGVYRLIVEADAGVLAPPPELPAPRLTLNPFILDALRRGSSTPPPLTPVAPEESVSFTIEVRRHVPAPEFFWLALLLITPYPLYRLLFKRGNS